MNDEYVISIDLQTTNSYTGPWKNEKTEIISNEYGERITLSNIFFLSSQ